MALRAATRTTNRASSSPTYKYILHILQKESLLSPLPLISHHGPTKHNCSLYFTWKNVHNLDEFLWDFLLQAPLFNAIHTTKEGGRLKNNGCECVMNACHNTRKKGEREVNPMKTNSFYMFIENWSHLLEYLLSY